MDDAKIKELITLGNLIRRPLQENVRRLFLLLRGKNIA